MDVFRREGDYWAVVYAGTTVRIADMKGMGYLGRLLADPSREFHVLDLVTAQSADAVGLTAGRGGDAGATLDAQAKASYRRRMVELREELDEAERFGDPERASRARADLQTLADHVAAAVGLGGRDRTAASAAERARVSVTKAVKGAMRRIAEHHPALGAHLEHSVRTGTYCSYEPDPRNPPSWETGPATAPPSPAPGPPIGTSSTTLIGREAELANLSTLLKAVHAGRGALVVLAGDAGVGKTRLAAEILSQAAAQGARTALGRCPEAEDSLSLLPFTQVLETLATPMSDAELAAAAGEEAAQLAKVLPLLHRRMPGVGEPRALPPEAERQALLDAITTFLVRAAGDRGLVLVFDDLQWADEATLACLEYLAQRLPELPVLVLGTARSAGLEPGRPLARSWERLQRLHRWSHFSVEPLPPPAVADLLEALADRMPAEQLTEAVVAQTAGNPFFVEELYWHLADRALLFEEHGLASADPAALREAVPETVRLVLGHRLADLGGDARSMLEVAAVIGRSVDYALLSDVAGLSADALVDAVEDAQHGRLLEVTVDGGSDRLVLAHDLVRQTLLQGLSLPRRRRLHARVADALEQRVDTDEALAADLVYHLLHAQSVEAPRLVGALRRAGDQAMGRAAFADAHRHFDRALTHCAIEDRRVHAELLAERGRAARALGRLDEALADWQEAVVAFERLHEAEAAGELALDISALLTLLGRYHETAEAAQRGLETVGEAPGRVRARLLALVARWSAFEGDFAAADLALDQAEACAATLDEPAVAGHILLARSYAAFARFDCRECADTGLAAARLLAETGDEWEASQAGVLAQANLIHAGRFAEADDLAEGLMRSTRRAGHRAVHLWILRNTAILALLRSGDLDAYDEFLEQYAEGHRALGIGWASGALTTVGTAAFWRGDWEAARTHLEEGTRSEPASAYVARSHAALLRLDAYEGRHDAVRERWARYQGARRPEAPPSMGDRQMAIAGAEAWTVIGEDGEAAALYPRITDAIADGTLIEWEDLRLLATAAGVSAAAAQDLERAELHFAQALHQADTLPHCLEQPEARRLWAEALLRRRTPVDAARARELLTEARKAYRRLGMPRHAALTEGNLARC